jgi:FkbM family methyltransferase
VRDILIKSIVKLYRLHPKYKHISLRSNTTDHRVFYSIFIQNEFNLPYKLPINTIVDAGAYVGLSSIYFHDKYPKATIIALEPEKTNFEQLQKNTSFTTSIKPLNVGLWSRDSYLKVYDRGTGNWGFAVKEVPQNEDWNVRACSLSTLLSDYNLDSIDLLKVDIEGSEKEVFSNGTAEWLPKVNIIMVELHDRFNPGCTDALYNAITKSDWIEFKQGEKVILIRKSFIEKTV